MVGVREMITLLGSLLGFGSSFLPEVLNYFKANQAQKHRMEMMHLETELAQKRSEMKLVELDKQADIEETKGLYYMTVLSTLEVLSTPCVGPFGPLSLICFLLYSLPQRS